MDPADSAKYSAIGALKTDGQPVDAETAVIQQLFLCQRFRVGFDGEFDFIIKAKALPSDIYDTAEKFGWHYAGRAAADKYRGKAFAINKRLIQLHLADECSGICGIIKFIVKTDKVAIPAFLPAKRNVNIKSCHLSLFSIRS